MSWLNYHHLLYFWTVAGEGSLAEGSAKLHLTPQTVSAQLRTLEDALDAQLFDRTHRKLTLTDVGRVVYDYADTIFSLGRELQETLRGQPGGRPQRLVVGVADVVPKLVAYRVIAPALESGEEVRIACVEDTSERLLARLAMNELDVVLSDMPVPPNVNVRAFNHLLGESGVTFLAAAPLSTKCRRGFPKSLDGTPFLLPAKGTALRRSLELWFDSLEIAPTASGEFVDTALLKVFGQAGVGVFAVPTVIADDVSRRYKVRPIGKTEEIVDRCYAITVERRVQHPAVAAICDPARQLLY